MRKGKMVRGTVKRRGGQKVRGRGSLDQRYQGRAELEQHHRMTPPPVGRPSMGRAVQQRGAGRDEKQKKKRKDSTGVHRGKSYGRAGVSKVQRGGPRKRSQQRAVFGAYVRMYSSVCMLIYIDEYIYIYI